MTDIKKHQQPMNMAFFPPITSREHALSVIDRALDFRSEASDSARSRLNSAIKDSVNLQGFRDASRAQRHQLQKPVRQEVRRGNDKLAGAILRAWEESQEALRTVVANYLSSKGISVDGPDLQGGMFRDTWPRYQWAAECELIANEEANSQFDAEDIALMLCFVSGSFPADTQAAIESPLLQGWFDELSELPPEAPEWDYVDEFASSLRGIALAKITERVTVQVEAIASSITEMSEEFDEELRYLEIDIGSWSADDAVRADLVDIALDQITALKTALSEYHSIRPQASSRSEESERAPERERCEKAIFDIVAAWDDTMNVPEEPDDQASQVSDDDRPVTSYTDAVQSGYDSTEGDDSISPELGRLRRGNEALSSENDQLKQDSEHLRADLSALKDEIGQMKGELSQSHEMQEYWRRAYVSESAGQVRTEEDQPVILSSVEDALDIAEKTFPSRLRIALNSKSAKNSPFQKPDEVFDALAWLATEYHRRRSNPGAAPNFDKLIKESCPGWSYKSKQTEVTKEQFTEWYTTTLDGKSYKLDAHIGKGTSFDPHQIIRIAFDWDDDLKQVIVGFVGRHQRNRRS